MDYKIMRAASANLNEILILQHNAYQSEAAIYNDFSIQPLTQTLEQISEEFEKSVFLKAVTEGKIIGSVRAFESLGTVFIGKLIVHPEYQNRGIGRNLLKAAEREFPSRRYELFTGSKSEKNLSVYEKAGYMRFKEKKLDGVVLIYLEKHGVKNTTS